MKHKTNVPHEVSLGTDVRESTALLTGPDLSVHIPIFRKSNGKWYCRISAGVAGKYTVRCGSIARNFSVLTYKGSNNLYLHGPPKLSSDKTYLVYADETPFFWLADTWWFAGTDRVSLSNLRNLVSDRKSKGFTAVLLVAGIPPEVDYSPSYGFRDDGINTKYFDDLDKKIETIVSGGLVPCIVGSWGHHVEIFGIDRVKQLWHEIIARYAAYPVVFCLTGEVDVFLDSSAASKPVAIVPHKKIKTLLAKYSPETYELIARAKRSIVAMKDSASSSAARTKRVNKWNAVADYATVLDPFRRLWTVHPHSRNTASRIMGDPLWLSIDSIQSGHTASNKVWMTEAILNSDTSIRPVINLEPWYEGILGNFDASWQRYAFWMCMLAGAKGHTYGAHGIWQMAGGDNFMEHWGVSDWRKAKRYPGSSQVGIGKSILGKFAWWNLEPCSENISPHWSPVSPEDPMAARIAGHTAIIYFPHIQPVRISPTLLSAGPCIVSWIDPTDGSSVLSVSVKSPDMIPIPQEFTKMSDAVLTILCHEDSTAIGSLEKI